MSNRVLVYRTASNSEHRAAKELREAGIRAYVPRDRGGKRNPFTKARPAPAPGYVFAREALNSAYAKHVRAPLGSVDKAELQRLYLGRPLKPATTRPFAPGDRVTLISGPFVEMHGEVIQDRNRVYRVRVGQFVVTCHPQHMRIRVDPG